MSVLLNKLVNWYDINEYKKFQLGAQLHIEQEKIPRSIKATNLMHYIHAVEVMDDGESHREG